MKKIFLKTDVTVDAAGTNIPAKVTLDPFLWGFGVGNEILNKLNFAIYKYQ